MNSQLINQTQERGQRVLTCPVYGGFAMQLIIILYMCLFYPKEHIEAFKITWHLHAVWVALVLCVPTQICQKYIPSPSLNTAILTTYYHAYCLRVLFSVDVLHTL